MPSIGVGLSERVKLEIVPFEVPAALVATIL
jgi:hypothetical protein